MKGIIRIASILVFAVAVSQAGATEQKEPPAWLSEINNGRPGAFPAIEPCRLTYVFSWSNVVKAGQADVHIGPGAKKEHSGKLVGQSSGGSKGMARLLWPYDHSFTSVIDPRSLRPVAFQSTETDRNETLWTTNTYDSSGVNIKAVTKDKKSGKQAENTKTFPFPEALDLMSAFLYARSLPLNKGDKIVLLSHPFGSAYLSRFTVLGREKHKIGLGEFDAIKLDVDISKVQGNLKLKNYSKFKKATVWISDDEHRVPLEVRAEIMVGSIRATLKDRDFPLAAKSDGAKAKEEADSKKESPLRRWLPKGRGGSPFRRR